MLFISCLSANDVAICYEYYAFAKKEGPKTFYYAFAIMEKGDKTIQDLTNEHKKKK